MTHEYGAICSDCGARFTVREGGGFSYHLLHCAACGKELEIPFEALGDLHLRYVKGLDVPYSTATRDRDLEIQRSYPGEPLDEQAYHAAVKEHAGECECDGRFSLRAAPRCPRCTSARHERDPEVGGILAD